MAVELVSETFSGCVGETFQVAPAEGDAFETVLSSCEETPYGEASEWRRTIERVPFSLLFHARPADAGGAAGAGSLPRQGTFTLRHPELGEFQLFMVPLGPDEQGMRWQAVVS
jgi:hypothetical protein